MNVRLAAAALCLLPLAGCASYDRMAAADARIAALEAQQKEMNTRLTTAQRESTMAKIDAATAMMIANR